MAEIQSRECLRTIIKNTSGAVMVCPWLPPHGRTLAVNEVVGVDGDLFSILRAKRPNSNRSINALLTALDNGDITLRATPNPIFVDETSGASKVLTLQGGSAQFSLGCYDHDSVSGDE
jgi:hypothetical protein